MTAPQQDPLGFDFISEEEILGQKEPAQGYLGKAVEFGKDVGKRAERYGVRAGESLLGLPGDLVQLIRSGVQMLPGGITPEEDLNFAQRWTRKGLESLPGSEDLRAMSAESFPSLEPEGEFQRVEDEIVSDLAVLALPVKGKIPFAKALGQSLVGNLGKETVAAFGGGDSSQEATKLGLMVFTGMFGKGRGIKNHINNLFKEAEAFVPEGATVDYSKSLNKLGKLESELRKGAIDASSKPVLQMIEDLKGKAPLGRMAADEAIAFDRSINELMGDPALLKRGKKLLGGVKGANNEALDAFAKENPSWGDSWKEAKQAYQGIAQSEKIQKYIRNNTSLKDYAHAAAALGLEEAMIPGKAVGQLGALAGLSGAAYMGEVGRRVSQNPALRRYYANALNASLSENKSMLIRNLKGLERTMKKDLEDNPIEVFDFAEKS